MKLTCKRTTLTNAVQLVSGVVPSKTTKDVLKNIKLQVAGGKCTLIGSDSEIGMRCIVELEADRDGQALLPTARILSILNTLVDEIVTLDIDERGIRIDCGYSSFTLSTTPAEDFPEVASAEFNEPSTITSSAVRKLIRQTIFCTDQQSTRYALAGVSVELANGSTTFISTDSRRLAIAKSDCKHDREADQCVVPVKALQLLDRCLDDTDSPVEIEIGSASVAFRVAGVAITSQVVAGRFPDWRKILPKRSESNAVSVAAPLAAAVKQAQIVTTEESRAVEFIFDRGELRLSSQAANIGNSKIKLPIDYDGETVPIRLDPKYIAEFLKAVDIGSSINIGLNGSDDKIMMTCGDYQYVVMPLERVQ